LLGKFKVKSNETHSNEGKMNECAWTIEKIHDTESGADFAGGSTDDHHKPG
jgi:hypothetical protein